MQVFPSETSDKVTVVLTEQLIQIPKRIDIVDTNGRLVRQFTTGLFLEQELVVSDLPSGKYFVRTKNYLGQFIKY
jgi:hypothetical protein